MRESVIHAGGIAGVHRRFADLGDEILGGYLECVLLQILLEAAEEVLDGGVLRVVRRAREGGVTGVCEGCEDVGGHVHIKVVPGEVAPHADVGGVNLFLYDVHHN